MTSPAFARLCALFFAFASAASAQVYSVRTLAGQPGVAGSADGVAARFNSPAAVAIDTAGNVFVGESNSTTLRRIASNGTVSTIATLPGAAEALVLDPTGNVYVAEASSHVIWRVATDGTGQYTTDATSEDGYVAGAVGGAITTFHSADTNHDGKLGLIELLRVIELYNYRSGTTRTGQYHVQPATDDGFGTGP